MKRGSPDEPLATVLGCHWHEHRSPPKPVREYVYPYGAVSPKEVDPEENSEKVVILAAV
jgi:hypothetical protein